MRTFESEMVHLLPRPLDVAVPSHSLKCVSVRLWGTDTCFPASPGSSHSALRCSNLREGNHAAPQTVWVCVSVCCSAPTPGKYPAEPRKRSLFHYITSETQTAADCQSRVPEMSCMQTMVSISFYYLWAFCDQCIRLVCQCMGCCGAAWWELCADTTNWRKHA